MIPAIMMWRYKWSPLEALGLNVLGHIVLGIVVCIGLTGCGSLPIALTKVRIVAEAGANHNSVTAVDIVFVYDKNAEAIIPHTAPEWFASKSAIVDKLVTAIDVVTIQIAPAMVSDVELPARSKKAIAVYSYANYISASGQAKGNLTPYRHITINLKTDTVTYTPEE